MRAATHHRPARRLFIAISLAGALAAPAGAQTLQQPGRANLRDAQLRAQLGAQLSMANRQAILQQNQLSRLDAQIRTQRSLDDIRAQSSTPIVPPLSVGAVIDRSQIPSIPDDKLAASNARVKAAADNH